MEPELPRRVAMLHTDRTGITGNTARDHAGHLARIACKIGAASGNVEARQADRIDGTGRQAGLFGATLARMLGRTRRILYRKRKTESASITVPEPELRMDEDAERRRLQTFGLHRPLLERLPGWIGREIGSGSELLGERPDQGLRPRVEGIGTVMAFSPFRERRPARTADIAEQYDGPGKCAVTQQRSLARSEIHHAADQDAVGFEPRGNLVENW